MFLFPCFLEPHVYICFLINFCIPTLIIPYLSHQSPNALSEVNAQNIIKVINVNTRIKYAYVDPGQNCESSKCKWARLFSLVLALKIIWSAGKRWKYHSSTDVVLFAHICFYLSIHKSCNLISFWNILKH